MLKPTYDLYLAGPFFNDAQKSLMAKVRAEFEMLGLNVCDPQELSPVIVDLPPEQRKAKLFEEIFANNIEGMRRSAMIVACIDDRDAGTMFELGYFHHSGKWMVTFSEKGHGSNVMIAQATDAHFTSVPDLIAAMKSFKTTGVFPQSESSKVTE